MPTFNKVFSEHQPCASCWLGLKNRDEQTDKVLLGGSLLLSGCPHKPCLLLSLQPHFLLHPSNPATGGWAPVSVSRPVVLHHQSGPDLLIHIYI